MDGIEITTKKIEWLAWLCVAFVLPLVLLAVREGELALAAIFLGIFGIPIALLFIYSATLIFSRDKFHVHYCFGKYSIDWGEIRGISVGGGNLKLLGDGKTLTVPSYEFWHGDRRQSALDLFQNEIAKNGVEERPGYLALIPTFKGAKNA